MEWLATEWTEYYYPKVRSLKPLLARYEQNEIFSGFLRKKICSRLEFSLCEPLILADSPILRLAKKKQKNPGSLT